MTPLWCVCVCVDIRGRSNFSFKMRRFSNVPRSLEKIWVSLSVRSRLYILLLSFLCYMQQHVCNIMFYRNACNKKLSYLSWKYSISISINLANITCPTDSDTTGVKNMELPCLNNLWNNQIAHQSIPWWRHQMETFSALLALCAGNSPVPGEFRAQRPVTRRFDVSFDLRLNKRLSKQSWGWWFETHTGSLWRHCNAYFV